MREYRDDDRVDHGFCPKCGRELSDILIDARGYCEIHGWVFADWDEPKVKPEEEVDE